MARAESEQSRKVITDKEVICNIGTARYRLATALNNQYPMISIMNIISIISIML